MPYARTKEHAHELIDRMAPSQVSAVVGLLETILDPVSRAIANAPIDDEPESEEERRAVAASKAWMAQHPWRGHPSRRHPRRVWPARDGRGTAQPAIACLVNPRLRCQKSPNSFRVLYLHKLYVHSRTVNFILFACCSSVVRIFGACFRGSIRVVRELRHKFCFITSALCVPSQTPTPHHARIIPG